MVRSVERNHGRLLVHDGFDVDGAAPDALQIRQRVAGVVVLQLSPLELVLEIQLAAVFVVAVGHVDERPAVIGEARQQLLLDLLELPRGDVVGIIPFVVGKAEELVFVTELRREEGVDKRHVVVNAADLEDLLAAELQIFVPTPFLIVVVARFPIVAELAFVPTLFDVAKT